MADPRLTELFSRYYDGVATEAERRELMELLEQDFSAENLSALLKDKWKMLPKDRLFFEDAEEVKGRTLSYILTPETQVRRMVWLRRAVAVAAVLILIAGGYYYFDKQPSKLSTEPIAQMQDIAPGHAGAVLTLSDGRPIGLDTAKDGLIAMDRGVRIIKENGQIRYEGEAKETVYNETHTDRGRSWPVNLPDGSTVWLNTSSSVRYPLVFTGKERKVEMTGECYFEVIHNDKQPFRVALPSGIIVEDVGTAFNIRSYSDEASHKTTVTEGIVNVSTLHEPYMRYTVTAGRQAITANGKIQKVIPIDKDNLSEITAWKENRFRFRNAALKEILKEAARWYDMEVVYENDIDETFFISMSRQVPLSKLLHDIEQGGEVHFKIDGKRVTVSR